MRRMVKILMITSEGDGDGDGCYSVGDSDSNVDGDNLAKLLPSDWVANAVQGRGVEGDTHHIGNHLSAQHHHPHNCPHNQSSSSA